MNAIIEFINQPFFVSLLTITVGSYLLNLITDRRSRNDKLREKSIDFITNAGNNINNFYPRIYEQLRRGKVEISPAISEGLRDLFSTRMSVQVGSQAFLKSDVFHLQYFQLLDELVAVVTCISVHEQGSPKEETILKAQRHRKHLGESWPIPDDPPDSNSDQLVEELIKWMDMIVRRTTHLLTLNLNEVIR